MNVFDIIGPVMVGPSSSHTAGAVKIGYVSRKLMGESIVSAHLLLYGSFLATGKGHGTHKALVAGLLGMTPEDERIPDSLELAGKSGIEILFGQAELKDVHANSVQLVLKGEHGRILEIVGESIGGSRINIARIDGLEANFSGDYPTLIVHNLDMPGHIAKVTSLLSEINVNIAAMKLYRQGRGQNSVMILECDQEVPRDHVRRIEGMDGIEKVTYYSLEDGDEL